MLGATHLRNRMLRISLCASDREQEKLKRERPEGDHGFTIDVSAVHHHDRYSFEEYFDPGP